MGTWGIGIYSNDMAEDVRDACKEIFAFYDIEEGNKKLFQVFKDVLSQGWIDNNYASFWYALADWQWKHGLLTEQVKSKTQELLEVYAGIDDWKELGEPKDIIKRRSVLDVLKNQLQNPQRPLKKPKLSVAKPKHKPGDIIVFQASAYDLEESYWTIDSFTIPIMFRSKKISNSQYEDIVGYNANGKYMALLCIGMESELHSEFIPNVYDKRSVYVWYDYLSENMPTVETLNLCGFLPLINWQWKDFNKNITDYINWTYSFVLATEKFKENENISKIIKLNSLSEVERFHRLFLQKQYSSLSIGGFDLPNMFINVFEEKNRMELLGENFDNLLDINVTNPIFLSPSEIDKKFNRET